MSLFHCSFVFVAILFLESCVPQGGKKTSSRSASRETQPSQQSNGPSLLGSDNHRLDDGNLSLPQTVPVSISWTGYANDNVAEVGQTPPALSIPILNPANADVRFSAVPASVCRVDALSGELRPIVPGNCRVTLSANPSDFSTHSPATLSVTVQVDGQSNQGTPTAIPVSISWSGYANGNRATMGQAAPALEVPSVVPADASLTYFASPASVCSIDAATGALNLVQAGKCKVVLNAFPSNPSTHTQETSSVTVVVNPAPGTPISGTQNPGQAPVKIVWAGYRGSNQARLGDFIPKAKEAIVAPSSASKSFSASPANICRVHPQTGQLVLMGDTGNCEVTLTAIPADPATHTPATLSVTVSVSESSGAANNKITRIVASYDGFAGLKSDGTVVAWGEYDVRSKPWGNYRGMGKVMNHIAFPNSSKVVDLVSTRKGFAALREDGTLVSWGHNRTETNGDLSFRIDPLKNVESVTAHRYSFSASKKDGSAVVWGQMNLTFPKGIKKVAENEHALAILKKDGSVETGSPVYRYQGVDYYLGKEQGGSQFTRSFKDHLQVVSMASKLRSGVTDIATNSNVNGGAFLALKSDGTVVAWGNKNFGGNILPMPTAYLGTSASSRASKIYGGRYGFAVLRADKSVVHWGVTGDYFEFTSGLVPASKNVASVFPHGIAFLGVTTGKGAFPFSVHSNRYSAPALDISAVETSLQSAVTKVTASKFAFALLKSDGSVVAWGNTNKGGSLEMVHHSQGRVDVSAQLASGVKDIVANEHAFAALKKDGSVVTWGGNWGGGDSRPVASDLASGVIQIVASEDSFSALKDDGTVVTWRRYD